MAEQSGKEYVIHMARAMQAVGRLNDFVVGLAYEGAVGALGVVLNEFGANVFVPGRGSVELRSYDPGYMTDAYDAAVAGKRPNVVEWLAQNQIPVHGKPTAYTRSGADKEACDMHYNAVLRALYAGDEESLVSMIKHGVFQLKSPLLSKIALFLDDSGKICVGHSAGWGKTAITNVDQPRLLDLCAAYGLPKATRAILDAGYLATPSFFKVAIGLGDQRLIEESIGKSTHVKLLASKLLAAAADDDNVKTMRLALALGANPNEAITDFGTKAQPRPLFFCKGAKAVHLLCDASAYVESRNDEGMTPALYFASVNGAANSAEILTALIECGADVTARAKDRTIAQLAANRDESVKRVIRAAKTGHLVKKSIEDALDVGDPAASAKPRSRGMAPI